MTYAITICWIVFVFQWSTIGHWCSQSWICGWVEWGWWRIHLIQSCMLFRSRLYSVHTGGDYFKTYSWMMCECPRRGPVSRWCEWPQLLPLFVQPDEQSVDLMLRSFPEKWVHPVFQALVKSPNPEGGSDEPLNELEIWQLRQRFRIPQRCEIQSSSA